MSKIYAVFWSSFGHVPYKFVWAMPGVSAPNNTEPKGPKHLNMIEMAAPSR